MRRISILLGVAVLVAFFGAGSASAQNACEGFDSGRKFEDTDCDGVKDGGEEYYGLAGSSPGADSIGTSELNDASDTATVGHLVAVDSASTTLFEYLALADEIVSDGDTLSIDHDATTNFDANEHIDHTGVTMTAGQGLTGGGTIAATRTFDFDYSDTLAGNPALGAEECVFTSDGTDSGGFLCEGTTANTNEQLYLFPGSDAADSTNYFALGASDGDALAGDSATSFFDAGEVEDARVVDTLTISAGTVNLENSTLTNIADNEVLVGTGSGTAAYTTFPQCDESAGQVADFDGSTFSCVTVSDDEGQSIVQSGGDFSATDDAIKVSYVVRDQTTDATQGELFLNGSSTRMTLASDSSWAFECRIGARRTDADGETAAYVIAGAIDNNAGTTALSGGLWKDIINEDTTAWDCTAEADDTNDALVLKCTGEAAKTVNWVGACDTTEVTG